MTADNLSILLVGCTYVLVTAVQGWLDHFMLVFCGRILGLVSTAGVVVWILLVALVAFLFIVGGVVPAALKERLKDHSVGGEDVRGEEGELVRLVVVVRIDWCLDWILDQFLECPSLANKFYKFWDAAASAENHKFFLFKEQLLNRAALLLVQQLVDLHIAPIDRHN